MWEKKIQKVEIQQMVADGSLTPPPPQMEQLSGGGEEAEGDEEEAEGEVKSPCWSMPLNMPLKMSH